LILAEVTRPESGTVATREALTLTNFERKDVMTTQLRLFSTTGSENFSKLEKEVNDWLTAKGDSIHPVNSQTATCAVGNGREQKESQAVIIALWYLDSPDRDSNHS